MSTRKVDVAPRLLVAHVDVSLVANSGFSSLAIELFGAGGFSHVDLVVPDAYAQAHGLPLGSLLGARSDCVGGQNPGVRIRPPGYQKWPKRLVLRVPCTPAQADKWLQFGIEQIGKPYDTAGLLESFSGLAFARPMRNWREESGWWCSELAMRMGGAGGVVPTSPLPVWKITPGDCALVYSAVGGVPILRVGM